MTGRLPKRDAETIRYLAAGKPRASRQPMGDGGRRALLAATAGGILATGAGLSAVFLSTVTPARPPGPPPAPPRQRLGPRAIAPPLLRTARGDEDTLFVVVRRTEQDETDPADLPAPRERIEVIAFGLPGFEERFAAHVATVPRGTFRSAGLLGGQGTTLWMWLDGLGAVSAEDGRLLADAATLAARNPAAVGIDRAPRGQFRLTDSLIFEARGVAWRLDPRDLGVVATTAARPRAMPPLVPAAPVAANDFRVTEARIGAKWLGLAAADSKLPVAPAGSEGARFLEPALPAGSRQQLWRGEVLTGDAVPLDASAPEGARQAALLADTSIVPQAEGVFAGFLAGGDGAALLLQDPPGAVLLEGAPGQPLSLLRVDAAGAVAWRSALPIARLRGVLPGGGHLVLAGSGPLPEERERLVAVSLADGAVTAAGLGD